MDKRLVLLHKQSGCSYPCPCLHRSTISEVLGVSTTPALPCNQLHRYYPCQLESEIRNVTCKLLVDKNFNESILQERSRHFVFAFVHPPPLCCPWSLPPPTRSSSPADPIGRVAFSHSEPRMGFERKNKRHRPGNAWGMMPKNDSKHELKSVVEERGKVVGFPPFRQIRKKLWVVGTQTRDHYSTHQGNYFVRYLGGSRSDPKT